MSTLFICLLKVTHAKLQIEKTRLALAVQACEAAAACISRPNTPQDPVPHRVPENELNARTKLEDFLDQVRFFVPIASFVDCCFKLSFHVYVLQCQRLCAC